MSSTQQEAAAPKQQQNNKKNQFKFDFSTTDDLFISTMGRQYRNKNKKLDKINQTEKGIRKGDIPTPTDTQKEMIAGKPALVKELKEIQDLLELYLKSNPNYARKEEKKEEEPAVVQKVEEVVHEARNVEESFKLIGYAFLNHNMKKSQRLSVGSQAENAALDELIAATCDVTRADSDKWEKKEWLNNLDKWSKLMTKWSAGSKDHAHENVSFQQIADQMPLWFQQITDNSKPQAKEVKAEAQKVETAAVVAEAVQKEEVHEAKADEAKEVEVVAATVAASTEESKDEQVQNPRRGRGGRGNGEYRGRGNGEYRGRGNGEWRGRDEHHGERRGRGGYHKGPREDEDGFIVETGEKPKPRGRGGNYRGQRGGERGERGSYRGPREGTRGGNRPREEGTTQPAQQTQSEAQQ